MKTPPTYRALLKTCFPGSPAEGITEARRSIPMEEYRRAPGLAPSDIKAGSEDFGTYKERGHFTNIANDRLARWYAAEDEDLPPGLIADTRTRDKDLGSVYHSLLMTPDQFGDEFVVATPDIIEVLQAARRERKRQEDGCPSAFSNRLKEAQEYKKKHGHFAEDPEEQAAILAAAQERYCADDTFPQKEYSAWLAEQSAAGKTVIPAAQKSHAERMVDALYSQPENSGVGEFVKSLNLSRDRVEVSLFAVTKLGSRDDAPLVQLKGRPDMIPHGDAFIDPKTCLSAHPIVFGKQVETAGYDLSMAGYCLLSELLAGHPSVEGFDFPKRQAGFLAQEKKAPFLARIHYLPDDWLRAEKQRFKTMLLKLVNLWNTNKWSDQEMAVQIGTLMPSRYKADEIELFA